LFNKLVTTLNLYVLIYVWSVFENSRTSMMIIDALENGLYQT